MTADYILSSASIEGGGTQTQFSDKLVILFFNLNF